MRAYQNGNIARLQRAAFEIQTVSGGFVERAGDFVGAIVGGTAAQNVFVGFFIVVLVQPTELYGRTFGRQPAFGTRRTDFRIADVFQNERAFFEAEQRADAADKRGVAAVVGGERVAVPRVFRRLKVGVNVRTAKAVNRLFGVADEEQRAVSGDENLWKISYCSGSVSWNSSISAISQFSATARAGFRRADCRSARCGHRAAGRRNRVRGAIFHFGKAAVEIFD